MDPLEEFDHIVIINPDSSVFKENDLQKEDQALSYLQQLTSLIIEGLTERLLSIKALLIPLRSKRHLPAIGLHLSQALSNSPVIRGPPSGSSAGKIFREFWGSKSELRHVDGDLYESVLWDSSQNITLQVIDFLLTRHFNASCSGDRPWYQISSTRLNGLLHSFAPAQSSLSFPPRASNLHLICTIDRLNLVLHEINDHLPLNVISVQAVSAEFRGTSVFSPIITEPPPVSRKKRLSDKTSLHEIHYTLDPVYVIITIETSGKWPRDNLLAFLHMKRLFLLRVHDLLATKSIPSRVVDSGMLDVFINGITLRVSFFQPLEKLLIRKALDCDERKRNYSGILNSSVENRSSEDLRSWILFNESLPAVTSQLNTLSRANLGTFSDACRLAKRWLSAHGYPVIRCPDLTTEPVFLTSVSRGHCLGDGCISATSRFSEIAVELMVVRTGRFTTPVNSDIDEYSLSSSPLATFLRFLKFLFTFDWDVKPLLVDLNDGFIDGDGPEKVEAALANFARTKRTDLPAVVIITPLDLTGTDWTSSGPSCDQLLKLQSLAKRTYDLLRAMLLAGARLSDIKELFRPDISNMDVVLSAKPILFRTRFFEGIDIDYSFMHSRRGKANKPATVRREPVPVAITLPDPGMAFWPNGYLCDPQVWLLRQLQILNTDYNLSAFVFFEMHAVNMIKSGVEVKFPKRNAKGKIGSLFDFFWDRHSARWIGLKFKNPEALSRLTAFTEDNICGFSCHREATVKCSTGVVPRELGATVDHVNLLEMLRLWSSNFIDSITFQRSNFPIPGNPVSTGDKISIITIPQTNGIVAGDDTAIDETIKMDYKKLSKTVKMKRKTNVRGKRRKNSFSAKASIGVSN